MTQVVLAISVAYVVMAVVLLCMGLTSRFAWWLKGGVVVVTSVFFVESFFATNGLLGWPGSGRLPHRFQLLWTRVVEPDRKVNDPGARPTLTPSSETTAPLPRQWTLSTSRKATGGANTTA